MILKKTCLFIFVFFCLKSFLWSQSVQVARWKNNAKAAYTIIMDGYGTDYFGNLDTIINTLSNHSFTVSFSAIADWDACDQSCKQAFIKKANNSLTPAGHVIINHSWDADSLNQDSINLQIDSSNNFIEQNIINNECLFYAFPKGFQKDPDFMDTLRQRRFIGSRTNLEGNNVNPYDFADPFLLQSKKYDSAEGISGLNQFVDDAISAGGFALRTCQNIGGGGTEPMPVDNWKNHLSYCRGKADSNKIWMADVQEIIKYAMERENFAVNPTVYGDSLVRITFDTQTNEINPSAQVDNAVYDDKLTLLLSMPGKDTVKCNADPWGDTVDVTLEEGAVTKVMQDSTQLYPEPYLHISSTSADVSCKAGGFSFTINTNMAWNIGFTGYWLNTSAVEGFGPATIMVFYDENTELAERSDTLFIAGFQVDTTILVVKQAKWTTVDHYSVQDFELYPCPADNHIHIITPKEGFYDVQLIDMKGRHVLNKQLTNQSVRLDISSLSPGVYLIKLVGTDDIRFKKFLVY